MMTTLLITRHTLDQIEANGFESFKNLLLSQPITEIEVASDVFYNVSTDFIRQFTQTLCNTQVTTLRLSHNQAEQFELCLAQALPGTPVKVLDLSYNQIRTLAPEIAKALQGSVVTKLDLAHNAIISDAIFSALQHTQVNTLILKGNRLKSCNLALLNCTKVDTLSLAHMRLNHTFSFMAQDLPHTSIKRINVKKCFFPTPHGSPPTVFYLEKEEALQKITLDICRRDYVQRLALAEYQGSILKVLYQSAFPENTRPFPPAIAHMIAKFLGYNEDNNLVKRFCQGLKETCSKYSL